MTKLQTLSAACIALACSAMAYAQDDWKQVSFHGSIQSDILIPQEDKAINTGTYDDWALTNTYADLSLYSKYLDAGARLEFTEYPLPGFEPEFKGWGVPNFYLKLKLPKSNIDLTLGDIYDQFGSGLIFRTYEERSLGIDNSIRGARLNMNAIMGVQLKALGGVQRRFWDWSTDSWLAGADVEVNFDQYSQSMRDKNMAWMVGASYVLLDYTEQSDIIVPGTNYKLNTPSTVHAFDARTRFQSGNYNILAEYAWRSQDPSFDNGYIYRRGNAVLLSASYSAKGVSALIQAKRSDNMSFRSQRSISGTSGFINNMPAFAYQHTYALPAIYPYATQAAKGEWAFQGEFGYSFRRGTALGGRYGTKLKLNISHIRALDKDPVAKINDSYMGTDGYKTSFFKMGEMYYQDINVQLEKKFSSAFKLNLMYMNQRYNKTVIEGEGGMVKSNIFVAEGKLQFNNRLTLRGEVQYLSTKQDQGDWTYGLLELSVQPYLMFTVSDMWNNGSTDNHYYMASVTGTYKSHRLMVGYGCTRAGYNCSGGVCRFVPASKGLNISYNFNF